MLMNSYSSSHALRCVWMWMTCRLEEKTPLKFECRRMKLLVLWVKSNKTPLENKKPVGQLWSSTRKATTNTT